MTLSHRTRHPFGTQPQAARAPRRGKARQSSPNRHRPRLECLEDRLALATLMVTSLADSGAGTLRAAIQASVNRTSPGTGNDTIQFDPSLDGGWINLTSFVNDTSQTSRMAGPSAFFIGNGGSLVIDGRTGLSRGITIARSSSTPFRLFDVDTTSKLTLESLSLYNGHAKGFDGYNEIYINGSGGGGGAAAGLGGAIFNRGALTLRNSTLTGNIAEGGGIVDRDVNAGEGSGGAGLGTRGGVPGFQNNTRYGGEGGGPNRGGGGNSGDGPTGGTGGFGGGGGGGGGYAARVIGSYAGQGGAGGFGGGGGGGSGADDDRNSGAGGAGGFGGGGGGSGSLFRGHGGGGRLGVAGAGGFGGGAGAGRAGGGGAGMGGAVFNQAGTVIITNSTFAYNSAIGGAGKAGSQAGKGLGGAVFGRNGTITVSNSTFSLNAAAEGGRGIFLIGDGAQFAATINNTIIGQGDTSVSDLAVDENGGGYGQVSGKANLIRTTTVFGIDLNLTGALTSDPQLGPLQENGGLTRTMALGAGSAALDGGINAAIPAGVTTDQRGQDRIRNGTVDMGAYESLVHQTIAFTPLSSKTYGDSDFPLSASSTSGLPVTYTATGKASVYQSGDQWYARIAGAGAATITAHTLGDSTYNAAPDVAQTFSIAKANAVVVITPYTSATTTYDGRAHSATIASITGVLGETGSAVGTVRLNTTHTNAGTYASDSWSFTGSANYNNIGSTPITNSIGQATLTYVANPATRLYGAANPAFSGSVIGFVGGETLATATTGSPTFSSTASPSSPAGQYAITGSGLAAKNGNYAFVQAAGNATALTVRAVTTANLQTTLADQSSVVLQVDSSEIGSAIGAINNLTAPTSPVTITLNLTSGSYAGLVASPPANVTLVLTGGSVVFVGASPSLTVRTGTVIARAVNFTNSTDSPTILVTGGRLILRDGTVQETTGGNQPAILVTGGSVDLGTEADPGNNTLVINGPGLLIRNTGTTPVSALGDAFRIGGTALADPYLIAGLIDDGLDSAGRGLVSFRAGNAFITAGGNIQRAVDLVPAGTIVNVQAGGRYDDYTFGSKPLTVAFQNGPTLRLASDAAFGAGLTTLRITGSPRDNAHIDIDRGHGRDRDLIEVGIDGYPDAIFAPTGGLVVHGGGGRRADIKVSPQVTLPALLFAGGADADIQGGGGPTVALGGGGDNTKLKGGKGRSILIAGKGAAKLRGQSGEDILVGGTTAFDNNEAALLAVLAEWNSGASILQRMANLQGASTTLNGQAVMPNGSYEGGYFLNTATVQDNGLPDDLEGGSDLDWVFAGQRDRTNRSRRGQVVVNIA